MPNLIQFVPPSPLPVAVPLPGLSNGNILALKLGNNANQNNFWALLAVERATVFKGDLTYYGQSLMYVIGDETLTWTRLIIPYEGRLQTFAQLNKVPLPPLLTKLRLQPQPDGGSVTTPVMEVPGILITAVNWDPINRYSITFRGNWCPLFRQP